MSVAAAASEPDKQEELPGTDLVPENTVEETEVESFSEDDLVDDFDLSPSGNIDEDDTSSEADDPKPEAKPEETPPSAVETPTGDAPQGSEEEKPTTPVKDEKTEENELEVPPPPEKKPEETAPPSEDEITASRKQYFDNLVKGYEMTDTQLEQMEEDPKKFFSEFAASAHMTIMESVAREVQQMIPNLVGQQVTAQASANDNENDFFEAWPELKGHNETIAAVGKQYRELNPTASREDAIEAIGVNALLALGVPAAQIMAKMAQKNAAPSTNPQVEETTDLIPPHSPAAPSRASSKNANTPPAPNVWQEMIED